ncbi:hypothetical protein ABB37_05056 [Leptomonas pyrrhocoris]|uniref:PARP-type domain-containing protein n=1 Tax=Leptomonas pyrrhocoris TaxID=157538 RepID=A0A0M9G137_LEPPY|nr:hypothetical protein ABB37_05056 [Leptomonas pyrrhocoris]KPA80037.1 hypothetical protein ABB37_05056 [Leptomonas pyrrhocoris]|eukprot:XP_015658476.1 hypothetical protein ABB37_05056 [Leptomonas pyrrhocoris]
MPKLCVEYSKSGRAKCSLTSCGKKIEKNELRIGTEVILPYSDDGVETWKWRHLCCFTERQLGNARGTGDIDNIQGEDDLAPADKALVQEMREGKLVGATTIIGRIGDVAHSRLASELTGKGGAAAASKGKAKTKKSDDREDGGSASASPGEKRARAPRKKAQVDDDVDSEATDEYEVAVEAVSEKPKCPYGADCFRTNPEHFQQYSHDGDAAESAALATTKPTMKPVIKRKKTK